MGTAIRSYRDLIVWQKSMDLACEIPRLTAQLPREEFRSLGDQFLRAAISIPANIAEGHGQRTRRDYARFLAIASGSLRELETFLLLMRRRGLAEPQVVDHSLTIADEVGRMLTVLRRRLIASA